MFLIIHCQLVNGSQTVSEALQFAMDSRNSCSVDMVTTLFNNAAGISKNPSQKISIFALLADFLMKRKEWHRAIDVFEKVLSENSDFDKPWALYGKAQALLMLGEIYKARATCSELKKFFPDNPMIVFAKEMAAISQDCVHARLAVFFADTPSIVNSPKIEKPIPDAKKLPQEESFSRPTCKITAQIDKKIHVNIGFWESNLTGNIDARGMALDIGNDADFGRQAKLAVNAKFDISGRDQLTLSYNFFDHHSTLINAVTFDNLLYIPGSSVELNTNLFDIGLSRRFGSETENALSFLYGLKFNRIFMDLIRNTPLGPQIGELRQELYLPYIGLEGTTHLSNSLALNGIVKFFSINSNKADSRLSEFELALVLGTDSKMNHHTNKTYGVLGYRFLLIHGKNSRESSEISFSGPILSLETRF